MIRFGHIEVLYLLFLVPLLGVFLRWRKTHYGRRMREKFAAAALLLTIAPNLSFRRQTIKDLLLLAALALIIFALADPQMGTRLEEVKREGIDLVVAVDVSNSMLAKDIAPSRLEKSQHEVQTLLHLLQGDRVALVAFAGKAVIECPLTIDYGAAEIFLDVLEPNLISAPGTSLGNAIRTSLQAFDPESRAGKAMLLITDGEDHEAQVEEAVKEAKKLGVIIHTVGVGSVQGVPIPTSEEGGDFKRDRQGNVVVTRLDETALQQISGETGGLYQRCSSSEDELKDIFSAISGLEKGELGTKKYTEYEHRYQYPLILALAALVVEFILSDRRMRLPKFLRFLAVDQSAAKRS